MNCFSWPICRPLHTFKLSKLTLEIGRKVNSWIRRNKTLTRIVIGPTTFGINYHFSADWATTSGECILWLKMLCPAKWSRIIKRYKVGPVALGIGRRANKRIKLKCWVQSVSPWSDIFSVLLWTHFYDKDAQARIVQSVDPLDNSIGFK